MLSTLLSPYGRVNRLQYWGFHLIIVVASATMLAAVYALAGPFEQAMAPGEAVSIQMLSIVVPLVIWFVCAAWSGLCISIKRCHDRDKSGWWLLIQLIPVVGPLWCLVELGFLPGTSGPNHYDTAPPYEPFPDRYAF